MSEAIERLELFEPTSISSPHLFCKLILGNQDVTLVQPGVVLSDGATGEVDITTVIRIRSAQNFFGRNHS